jgi:DNA-binding MarR family transcriptional regulator
MEEDKATVAGLAEALGVTHQMATQRVNTLEKLGLVFRKPNPEDKRAKSIHLTELGTKEGKKLQPITAKINIIFEQLNNQIECDLMTKIRQAELALIKAPLQKRIKELDASITS